MQPLGYIFFTHKIYPVRTQDALTGSRKRILAHVALLTKKWDLESVVKVVGCNCPAEWNGQAGPRAHSSDWFQSASLSLH